jgi:hypothetical protein
VEQKGIELLSMRLPKNGKRGRKRSRK